MNIEKYKYTNLVFQGGGVKGFAHIGVVKKLEEIGLLSNIKRFAGTSVGSLIASLLAIGFTADEIIEQKDKIDFSVFKIGCLITALYRIWKFFGVHPIDALEKQIREIIETKISSDITLSELYSLTGNDLVIVTCCLNRQKSIYLHHSKFPNVKLIDAIMSSMCVPFMFYPKKYNFLNDEKDLFVDGGIVDNFPLFIFNDLQKLESGKVDDINRLQISKHTLGIKLICKLNDDKNSDPNRVRIKSILDFSISVLNSMLSQSEHVIYPSHSYSNHTILVPTKNIYFLETNVDSKKINQLIQNGKDSVEKYFGIEKDT
jgi:NTE family protein